jgi:tetratricopeptide (TPR) repeat protein
MIGVPAAGLPKTTSTVSRNVNPAVRAAAAWSITAKTMTPLASSSARNRATTSPTLPAATLVTTALTSGITAAYAAHPGLGLGEVRLRDGLVERVRGVVVGGIERAQELYERAMFGGDLDALGLADRELDAVEAGLCLGRGRLIHVRFCADRVADPSELALFERAAELYGGLGDVRGQGEAAFWIGCYLQVCLGEQDRAVPYFEQSLDLAEQVGDALTKSYALRHLSFVAQDAGRTDEAHALMTESTELRRTVGFLPGVAANLVALAHFAIDAGRTDEAGELLSEAEKLAAESDAGAIAGWVVEARNRV